jgi:hypothetical protein
MTELLVAMQDRCSRRDDAAAKACANVAVVAAALLDPDRDRSGLTPAQRDELRDVEGAAAGSLRFLRQPDATEWSEARPIGAYERQQYAPLYRATVYVRKYRRAWPEATRAAWREHAEALRAGDGSDLARAEAAWSMLFGVSLDASGAGELVSSPDRVWLVGHAGEAASAHEKLVALFTAVPMRLPAASSDGVLRLCHELAVARPTDPLFTALPAAQWQAKWRDAAAFAYVGQREIDGLAFGPCAATIPPAKPTVVVEPLPAVWQAVEWLLRRQEAVGDVLHPPAAGATRRARWITDVLAALRLQQKGEDLPAALEERLRDHLLSAFGGADDGLLTTIRIEGARGSLRRAVPQLVRVPIVWRGETKKALALRLFIEEQGPGGKWEPPATAR